MCGKYELNTTFHRLPSVLKKNLPNRFEEKYVERQFIKPNEPVLVLKNEGRICTSLMLWGFISEWAKNPFEPSMPKPFNARAETVKEKRLFRGSWRNKRCVLPASSFFEKGHRISRKDSQPFWIGGLWNKWMGPDGSELETCCVLTTEPNELLKPLHNRMPVIIPNGLEEDWIAPVKDIPELNALEPILCGWDPAEWEAKQIISTNNYQMNLF